MTRITAMQFTRYTLIMRWLPLLVIWSAVIKAAACMMKHQLGINTAHTQTDHTTRIFNMRIWAHLNSNKKGGPLSLAVCIHVTHKHLVKPPYQNWKLRWFHYSLITIQCSSTSALTNHKLSHYFLSPVLALNAGICKSYDKTKVPRDHRHTPVKSLVDTMEYINQISALYWSFPWLLYNTGVVKPIPCLYHLYFQSTLPDVQPDLEQ